MSAEETAKRLIADPTDRDAIAAAVELVVSVGSSSLPDDLKIGGAWIPVETITDHLVRPLLVEGIAALVAALIPARAEVHADPGAAVTMTIHDS